VNKNAILEKASEEISALVFKLESDRVPFELAVHTVTARWHKNEKDGTEKLSVEIETLEFFEEIDVRAVDS
jgi:hypothetical protein